MFNYPNRYVVFRNDSPSPYKDYVIRIDSKDETLTINDTYRTLYPKYYWKIITENELDTYLQTRKKYILDINGFTKILEGTDNA